MTEIMVLALLVMLAVIIAGIGYECYKVGYSKGNREGMDMQKLLSKAFEDDGKDKCNCSRPESGGGLDGQMREGSDI